jgi:hypothetical protein
VIVVVVVIPIVVMMVPIMVVMVPIMVVIVLVLMFVAHVVHVLFMLDARMFDLTTLFVHPVLRDIDLVVPALRNEVHGSAARVVFAAMFRPVLLVSRGDVEIERLRRRDAHYNPCG